MIGCTTNSWPLAYSWRMDCALHTNWIKITKRLVNMKGTIKSIKYFPFVQWSKLHRSTLSAFTECWVERLEKDISDFKGLYCSVHCIMLNHHEKHTRICFLFNLSPLQESLPCTCWCQITFTIKAFPSKSIWQLLF